MELRQLGRDLCGGNTEGSCAALLKVMEGLGEPI